MSPFRRPDHGWAWLVASAVFAVLAASAFTVAYVSRTVHQLCDVILLQAEDRPAPTTERGKVIQKAFQRLADEYDCR